MFPGIRPLVAALFTFVSALAAADATAPDLPADLHQRLSDAYAATRARLHRDPAEWTVTTTLANGDVVTDAVVVEVGEVRHTLTLAHGAPATAAFTVGIVTSSATAPWRVSEQGGPVETWRPYEAPIALPDAYHYLRMSSPAGIDQLPLPPTLDRVDGDVVHYHIALPPRNRVMVANNLASLERTDETTLSPDQRTRVDNLERQARDLLDHGVLGTIDLATGIITEQRHDEVVTAVSGFRWRDATAPAPVDLPGGGADHGAPITTIGNRSDWIMIRHGYSGLMDMSGRFFLDMDMVNLATHDVRRIPFDDTILFSGCFLPDRKHVVVIAPGARKGVRVILPYVFDLNDRSLRPLAGNDAGGTSYIDPCLSPDGTRLAIHRNITLDVDKPSQIGVIDLASGDYTTIGNIIGGGLHLAWMPDGKHLLMTRGVAGSGHPDNIVCTMDLAGTVTDVCPGDGPVPLPDGRICFQNETDKCWRNCAADGSDSQVCGGGLPGCVMPARSPDGLRILFIQHGPDGEHPVIVSTADWSVTPAFALPGNWTSPVW